MKKVTDILMCLFITSTSLLVGMMNFIDGGAGIITIGCVACLIGCSYILGEILFKEVN